MQIWVGIDTNQSPCSDREVIEVLQNKKNESEELKKKTLSNLVLKMFKLATMPAIKKKMLGN